MTRASYSATPLLRSLVHRPQGVILVSNVREILPPPYIQPFQMFPVKLNVVVRIGKMSTDKIVWEGTVSLNCKC